jgi:nitric oxide reductase NorD protein
MEEFVGLLWHKLITRQASQEVVNSRVNLVSVQRELSILYRALGGAPGKVLEQADLRTVKTRRGWAQIMAGTQKYALAWQDERSVRLPGSLAVFPDQNLNLLLYQWLVAMAAGQSHIQHWFYDNQATTQKILTTYPGWRPRYERLLAGCLALRPSLDRLSATQQQQEQAIRQALSKPGSVNSLPLADMEPVPVPLWLYPQPLSLAVQSSAQSEEQAQDRKNESEPEKEDKRRIARKQAQTVDDQRQTDGLLIFQLESLFSWSEQVNLDRSEDDGEDDDALDVADDLDMISVARQRKSLASKVKFDLDLPSAHNDEMPVGEGLLLPEWDYRKTRLLEDFCLLQPMIGDGDPDYVMPPALSIQARMLKNWFAQLQLKRIRLSGQATGDEVDLDKWLQQVASPIKDSGQQNFFIDHRRNQRDLSCLLLADLSQSTDAYVSDTQRVIDVIRDAMLVFSEALSACSDRLAVYGFSSVKNQHVRYQLIKNFNESYNDAVRSRIAAVKPGFYTRMGAAIRQSVSVLEAEQTQHRLLLILSDGKPNDIDQYEGRYGIEDTRHAVLSAKKKGVQVFCITIDEQGHDYLPYLFGRQGYSILRNPEHLPVVLPKLYLQLTTANQ